MNDTDLLKEIEEKLNKLSEKERKRIIQWLNDKYISAEPITFPYITYPLTYYWWQTNNIDSDQSYQNYLTTPTYITWEKQ